LELPKNLRVKIVLASSLDGKIADARGVWRPLCPFDEERFYSELSSADAVIVGWRTVRDSGLDFSIKGKRIAKALIDPRGSLGHRHRFFESGNVTVFGCSSVFPQQRVEELACRGISVELSVKCPIEPLHVISRMWEMYGASAFLVAGGGVTAWHFLRKLPRVELQITYVPVVIGDSPYLNLRGESLDYPGLRLKLVKAEVCRCGEEIVCVYRKIETETRELKD